LTRAGARRAAEAEDDWQHARPAVIVETEVEVTNFAPGDAVTVREVIKLIEADGWYLDRQRSSHRQFKHLNKPGLVTVAGHPSKVLAPKTLKSILRQAGLAP
jgi:predicted RNA binding protein YcfA (HicA-like mRNA interferase family)